MYYDFSTKNTSFLRMQGYLQGKGVLNNKFHLAIINQNLIGIDPHAPNLAKQTKAAIYEECMNNYWYFLREVVRLPEPENNYGVFYKLNPANLAFNFIVQHNANIIFEGPRMETGKNTSVLTRILYENIFTYPLMNYSAIVNSKKFNDAKFDISKIDEIKVLLPDYIILCTYCNQVDPRPAPKTKTAAISLGRGFTSNRVYFHEFSFMKYNTLIMQSMMPGYNEVKQLSMRDDIPCGVIITQTPARLETNEAKYAYELEQGAASFIPELYDYNHNEILDFINHNSLYNFILIKMGYKELGLDEEWFKQMSIILNNDWWTIKKEILLQWEPTEEIVTSK